MVQNPFAFINQKIGYKVITGMVVTLFIPLALIIFFITFQYQIVTEERLREEVSDLVQSFAHSITTNPPDAVAPLYRYPEKVQALLTTFHKEKGLDLFVVDRQKRIIADAEPKEIGKLFTYDANNEIGKTLQDGIPRNFVETQNDGSPSIPLVVVPLRPHMHGGGLSTSGNIEGAMLLEYTADKNGDTEKELEESIQVANTLATTIGFSPVQGERSLIQDKVALQSYLESLNSTHGEKYTVLDPNGKILASSEDRMLMDTQFTGIGREAVAATLKDKEARVFSDKMGAKFLVFALLEGRALKGAIISQLDDEGLTDQQQIERTKNTLDVIGISIRTPLHEITLPIYLDEVKLQAYTEEFARDHDAEMFVLDSNRKILSAVPNTGTIGELFAFDDKLQSVNNTLITGDVHSLVYAGYHYMAVPLVVDGTTDGVVIMNYEKKLTENLRSMKIFQAQLLLSLLFVGVMAGLLIIFFFRTVSTPLTELKNITTTFVSGDLNGRAHPQGHDEIGQLGVAFNQMADRLQESYTGLAQRIAEKTEELQERVEEAETLNKMVVERELKMIELKKELQKLKGE